MSDDRDGRADDGPARGFPVNQPEVSNGVSSRRATRAGVVSPTTRERSKDLVKLAWEFCLGASLVVGFGSVPCFAEQQGTMLIFAVVTDLPEGKQHVRATVFVRDTVSDATLVANEEILRNVMWQKLELCHSLKAQAEETAEGYRIVSFRMLSPSMLPMPLQGVSGDCFLRKALEYAPLLE